MSRLGHASAQALIRYQHSVADQDERIADYLDHVGRSAPVPCRRRTNDGNWESHARGRSKRHHQSVDFAQVRQVSDNAVDWRTWISLASAIVAAAALFVSARNGATARRALAITTMQEERRSARLDVSVKDSVTWRSDESRRRWIGVHTLNVNPTDRDGSIISADLHVTYQSAANKSVVVKVPASGPKLDLPPSMSQLPIPAMVPANGAAMGWLIFELADGLTGGGAIDRYDVAVADSRGPIETVQVWVLRELSDGTQEA